MAITKSKAAAAAIIGIYRLLLFVFILGLLYYGQSLLIPLTLATLLAFLLSPLVNLLEVWIGKILAILIAVTTLILVVGLIGYILTNQIIDFSTKLPAYRVNFESKLKAFDIKQENITGKLLDTVDQIKSHLPGQTRAKNSSSKNVPIAVNVVDETYDLTLIARNFFSMLLDILAATGLVFLLLIFILFARQDLRGRLIRLIGPRRISATTRALNDAGEGVSQFLIVQLFLNFGYGVIVAIGLFFIGIPNAILWGALSFLLRFIPYLGTWIAAIFPFVIALSVSSSWIPPLFTLLLFATLDIIAANIVEPLAYASRTGISPFSLIISAIIWTLLWGPIGLLLSVPLTVCLVVLGRHIPSLAFLNVLLSDEKALALYEDCYQHLIAGEVSEAMALINNYLKYNSLANLYDAVFIPMLSAAETDYRSEILDEDQLAQFHQNIRDILEDLADEIEPEKQDHTSHYRVLCVGAATEQDELASIMLSQLLEEKAFEAKSAETDLNYDEMLHILKTGRFNALCISIVPPSPILSARKWSSHVRQKKPHIKIIVGEWGHPGLNPGVEKRLISSGTDAVVVTLQQAVTQLEKVREAKEKA